MAHFLQPHITASASVLDNACGTGGLTVDLEELCPADCTITAIDWAPAMVDCTRARTRRSSTISRVMNGETLEWLSDNAFDVEASCFGAFLFADRAAGWASALRVLKPGGLFATLSWAHPSENPLMGVSMGALKSFVDPTPPSEGVDSAPAQPGWLVMSNPDSVKDELTKAGFVDVGAEELQHSVVLTAERAVDLMMASPVPRSLVEQLTEEQRPQFRAKMHEKLAGSQPGMAKPLLAKAWLVWGRKPAQG